LDKHSVKISASIGISIYPYDSKDIDRLIKYADRAMYQAKHAGKGRYCFQGKTFKVSKTLKVYN